MTLQRPWLFMRTAKRARVTGDQLDAGLKQADGALAEDEVHVWHTSTADKEGSVHGCLPLLDEAEQSRAERFLAPEPRVQFILSRAFLRRVLGRYLKIEPREVRFRVSEHGKPELAGEPRLHFNLSHTEGETVVALTRAGRIGADVERIRRNLDPLQLADRFFSANEAAWLRAQATDQRFQAFFACWTAKEAYVKACGGGLSVPLASFGVIPQPRGNAELQLEIYGRPEESRRWSMWQLDLGPELRTAVTVEAVKCRIRWSQAGSEML